MRPHNAVALLGLLCLSHIVLIEAQVNGTAAMRARLTHRPGNGYAGDRDSQYAEEPKEQPHAYQEKLSCPETQPADQVLDVYLAHGVFSWRGLAAIHEEQQHRGPKKAAPLNKAELASSIASRAALLSKSKSKATTQALAEASLLMPTSMDEEGTGFQGTVDWSNYPPSEALAVGHHPTDDDLVYVLHAINGVAEIFPVEKNGRQVEHITPTKLSLRELAKVTSLDVSNLEVARVAAFFDEHKERFVIMWSTYAAAGAVEYTPVFVASSLSANPNSGWMVTALDLRPNAAQGVGVCHEQPPAAFHMANLQISYSKEAIFIGAAPKCASDLLGGERVEQELAALYVIDKGALCEPPSADDSPDRNPKIYAAVYFAARAWYRSVADSELTMVEDRYEPFNSYINPVRPQGLSDLDHQPFFVMKVSDSHLSVAALTDEENLNKMRSVETAPLLKAVVVGKGADYTNYQGDSDGEPVMHQPNTTQKLYLAGMGMPETHGGVVYWASQVNGMIYLVTGEYWGTNTTRIPSIYWAAIKPTMDICQLSREDQGMVASQDGLAFGYPVIAGKRHGLGGVIAFSYSGGDMMAGGLYNAYPGVAVTEVGKSYSSEGRGIDIIKRGTKSMMFDPSTLIPFPDNNDLLPWGYNSAAHVCGDDMWYAVPIPIDIPDSAAQYLLENVDSEGAWYGTWLGTVDV